jgi:transcriptional regulator with XRE-family HTH domain
VKKTLASLEVACRRWPLADGPAALVGLSVDYLVRLERGRASNPSPETLGALARAFLTTLERDMLYGIAGRAPPGPRTVPNDVPPGG